MADDIEKRMLAELDTVLMRSVEAERVKRDLDRQVTEQRTIIGIADETARRIRLALMAYKGEPASAGDANTANSRRTAELRKSN